MHLHPHMHSEIARDTQARRIAEARDASIGASRQRQVAHQHDAPVRRLVARLLAATLRLGG